MKKIIYLIMAIALAAIFSCDDVDGPSNPNGSIRINYNFAAVSDFGTLTGTATGRVYACLHRGLGLYPDYYVAQCGSTEDSPAGTGSITISGVYHGSYYLIVYYDQNHDSDVIPSKDDPYCIYDSNSTAGNATNDPYDALDSNGSLVSVEKGETTNVSITHDGLTVFNYRGAWAL
ncbi:MAG TPA: hypothetical protein P5295_14305 [Spirochaetota bacterium]|nr:hypothetical protein [Spirochaetota bacterium]